MQRYEKEIEEILRDLEAGGVLGPWKQESQGISHEKVVEDNSWHKYLPAARGSGRAISERLIGGTCLLLVLSLLLLRSDALLSAGLIVVSVGLLLVTLRRSNRAHQAADELAANDYR